MPASGSAPAISRTISASGQVGDAVAVRGAASDEDARLPLERADDLSCEARLADSGRPDDRRESSTTTSCTVASNACRSSSSSRLRPTNGVAMGRAKAGTSGRRPSSRQAASGWLFPFASIARSRLGDEGVADEAIGRLADEHLARLALPARAALRR